MTTICVVFERHGTRIKLISILPAYRQTVDKGSMHQRLACPFVVLFFTKPINPLIPIEQQTSLLLKLRSPTTTATMSDTPSRVTRSHTTPKNGKKVKTYATAPDGDTPMFEPTPADVTDAQSGSGTITTDDGKGGDQEETASRPSVVCNKTCSARYLLP